MSQVRKEATDLKFAEKRLAVPTNWENLNAY